MCKAAMQGVVVDAHRPREVDEIRVKVVVDSDLGELDCLDMSVHSCIRKCSVGGNSLKRLRAISTSFSEGWQCLQ